IAGFAVGIEADLLGHGLALAVQFGVPRLLALIANNDTTGNTHHGGTGRYRFGHHRIGTDLGPGAHGEGPEHLGPGTDHYTVLQGWMALALVPAGATQGHALVQGHVITDLGGLPY